jgi:hypothetical protein
LPSTGREAYTMQRGKIPYCTDPDQSFPKTFGSGS